MRLHRGEDCIFWDQPDNICSAAVGPRLVVLDNRRLDVVYGVWLDNVDDGEETCLRSGRVKKQEKGERTEARQNAK